MRPIKTLLVDDEEPALRRSERLLLPNQAFTLSGKCSNGKDALKILQENNIDLLLLDIEMPGISGLELVSRLDEKQRPIVVFITAYNEYAVQAFEYFAIDYILKPFSNERFEKMLERVKRFFEQDQKQNLPWSQIGKVIQEQKIPGGKISVKTGKKYHFIDPETITYVCADGNYCEIHLQTGAKHVHRDTISHMADILPPEKFIRIHHSHIISITAIQQVSRLSFGELEVRMKDERILKVSRKYKDVVKQLIR